MDFSKQQIVKDKVEKIIAKSYASSTERFLGETFAPELLSPNGRFSVISVYFVLCVSAIYGLMNLEIDFKIEYFIDEDTYAAAFLEIQSKYFEQGRSITVYVENAEADYASKEIQLQFQDFNDKLQRCYGCEESWFTENGLNSWYDSFYRWIEDKECAFIQDGAEIETKDYIDPQYFYPCFFEWLDGDDGESYQDNFRFTETENRLKQRIIGFKQQISAKKITRIAYQGPALLLDIRRIERDFGIPGTFSYESNYLDYESYFTLSRETFASCTLSIVAVIVVILFITANVQAAALVTLCVLLVDYLLLSLIFYWGLTFNFLIVINIVVAIGLSVDYSAHIAHTYLLINPPPECDTVEKKRMFKARMALSTMGSSVFHGGFSTFLSIVTLAPSKTYVFVVFFKMWFGIIIFGLANGFMLLPVLLSQIGPTEELIADHKDDGQRVNKDLEKRLVLCCYFRKKGAVQPEKKEKSGCFNKKGKTSSKPEK